MRLIIPPALAPALLALVLAAGCGGGDFSTDLAALDIAELQTLAADGDEAAMNEMMRRAAEVGEGELDAMETAAAAGDPKAVYQDAYIKGDAAAITALAAHGNIYAIFGEAMRKAASDNAAIAVEGRADALRAAEGGNADAALWVGRSMAYGVNGFDYKPSEGASWIEQAAEAGNAEAMFAAGELYQSGGQPDLAKARIWYVRALDAGIQPAARSLAALDTLDALDAR